MAKSEKSRSRGEGSVFQRGRLWWVAYYRSGKLVRESSKSDRERDAVNLLRKRLGEIGAGTYVAPDAARVPFEKLVDLVRGHYQLQGRASVARMETAVKQLAQSFAGVRALDISEDRLAEYQIRRRGNGAAPASVKYEFAILRKGFNLALARKLLPRAPTMPSVEVDNARRGFFEAEELERVMAELPDHVRPVIRFAALTGWRVRAEVLPLTWDRVDWEAGVVRLEVRSTKNRDGRTFPFAAEPRLEALLRAQRQYTDVVETMDARAVPWVFHRSGKRIRDFYASWHAACERAKVTGPDGEAKIPHDLRRTAVRNLERAGVSRSVSMKLTGHRTENVYVRYAIVCEADLREGVEKLARSFTERSQAGEPA